MQGAGVCRLQSDRLSLDSAAGNHLGEVMRFTTLAGAALAIGICIGAAPAQATDKEPCGKNMVCANAPQTVVDALQAAGFKAALSKSKQTGNPMIESAASGFNFHVFFYECEENKNCASLQFSTSFNNDDGQNSADLANKWNSEKRFSQMSFDPSDKSLNFAYDVSTFGGLGKKNFADVIDWWETMLGQLPDFFKTQLGTK